MVSFNFELNDHEHEKEVSTYNPKTLCILINLYVESGDEEKYKLEGKGGKRSRKKEVRKITRVNPMPKSPRKPHLTHTQTSILNLVGATYFFLIE